MKKQIETLVKKYPKLLANARIEIPTNWYTTVEDLCESIQFHIEHGTYYIEGEPKYIPQVECTQIKQKFGTLRFYTNIQEPTIKGMIRLASYICENTCEACGSRKDIGYTQGYIRVLCKECSNNYNWISKTEINETRLY